jgi:hypothetical protein
MRRVRSFVPCDTNLLRPCLVLDHPDVLARIVERSGASPVHRDAARLVVDATLSRRIQANARAWAVAADEAWNGPEYCAGHDVVVPVIGRIDVHAAFGGMMERARLVRELRKVLAARLPGAQLLGIGG